MKKYLFAFDIDGTLLNDKKKISFKTKRLLKKLNKKGHIIVLSSGRPFRSLIKYYNELNLTTPFVCYNGAHVFSLVDKTFPSYQYTFSKEMIKDIYSKIKPYIENIMCEDDKNIWADKKDAFLDKFFWYEGMDIHYGDINEIINKNTMTFIAKLIDEHKFHEEIENAIKPYGNIGITYWSGCPYFELSFNEATKGHAITAIANHYNIDKEDIISFGDSTNDIGMFLNSKTAIAMKNGKDSLKEYATHISLKDNNHNGIYYTIKAFLKNKLL